MGSSAPDIHATFSAQDTGVAAAIKELGVQLAQLKLQQDQVAISARGMGTSEQGAAAQMREARGAAKLLGEETGINLNRHLAGVIASSKTLGPLLNAAFPVAAAIGFAEVITSAADKYSKLIADTFIFTDAMKAEQAALVKANDEIEKHVKHVENLKKEFDLIGLQGSTKTLAQITQLSTEIEKAQASRNAAQDNLFGIRRGLPGIDPSKQGEFENQANLANAKIADLTQEQFNLEKQFNVDIAAENLAAAQKLQAQQDAIRKARFAAIAAGFTQELALYKAKNAGDEQANEADYAQGLESLTQYFSRRRVLVAEEAQKEVEALIAQRAAVDAAGKQSLAALNQEIATLKANASTPAQKLDVSSAEGKRDAEAIANKTKLVAIDNQIAIAQQTATNKQAELDAQEFSKRRDLQEQLLTFQRQSDQIQGDKYAAILDQIQIQAKKLKQIMQDLGYSEAAIDEAIAKLTAAETNRANFGRAKDKTSLLNQQLANKQEDLQLQVDTGKLFPAQAAKQYQDAVRGLVTQLQQQADTMERIAHDTGDVQLKEQADQAERSVARLKASLDVTGQQIGQFKRGLQEGLTSDLATFLGSTINQVHGVKDAFQQLGSMAVATIQRIVAQLIAEIVVQKIVNSLTGSQGGQQQGKSSSADTILGSTLMIVGGSIVKEGAKELKEAAQELTQAATTLLFANLIGGGAAGFADGGLVTGPGGPTADAIPAMLSAGEFVVKASSVDRIGVDKLAAMNAGVNIPNIRSIHGVSRFADGGLVQGGPGGGMDLRLGIGLDAGLILKHLSSKAAGKVVLQHLTDNPKAANKALQRG